MSTLTLRKSPSGPDVELSDTIVAPGEVLGLPIDAAESGPATPLTGFQLGELVRFDRIQTQTLSGGTQNNFPIADGTTTVDVDPNGGVIFFTGFRFTGRGNSGAFFTFTKSGASDSLVLVPDDLGSDAGNRIQTPGNLAYEMPAAQDTILLQAIERPAQPNVFQVVDRLVPASGVGPELNGQAVITSITVTFPADAGGAPDDVTILAVLPFGVRVLDALIQVSTSVGGSSVTLRSSTGGGGTALTSALSTAATGTVRNNDAATRTSTTGLFLRRSDSGVAGTFTVTLVRT